MTAAEIARLPKDEQFCAYVNRYQELHQFLDGTEADKKEEAEIVELILPALLDSFAEGFCQHLEVLCGSCTIKKGFAIWHRPPTCGEGKEQDKDYLCLRHALGAMAEDLECIACFERERLYNIAYESLNVAGGLTNYVEPRPALTNAERAIQRLQKELRNA